MQDKIQFRVTEEEKELIRKKAKANGMKMSEYVRYASLSVDSISVKITTEIESE
jgi:uncharacterized protein (DUF1778 family)